MHICVITQKELGVLIVRGKAASSSQETGFSHSRSSLVCSAAGGLCLVVRLRNASRRERIVKDASVTLPYKKPSIWATRGKAMTYHLLYPVALRTHESFATFTINEHRHAGSMSTSVCKVGAKRAAVRISPLFF